ncbi:SPATS2-like protein isoform X2 [Rhinatrema bivittatum]|uniref:SPATS2-like protein isoform X2 n=1 Tax=Rhinatrema bivittatum TaxID=194408 RepID=UPI00112EAB24|nr:SPATS2-like protein isoform X2 [Rhinatrema bivittatum]
MAETSYQGNIKDKITAVRSAVPHRSNNEIVLVLQQFDNNVDKTVQAFVDGSAVQVLKEWNMTGKKKINKKKKSKPKHHQYIKDNGDKADSTSEGPQGIYGYHLNDRDKEDCSNDFTNDKTAIICHKEKTSILEESSQTHSEITEKEAAEENGLLVHLHPHPCNGMQMPQILKSSAHQKCNNGKPRSRPPSIKSHVPAANLEQKLEDSIKKRGPTIEKSVKDLQRCTVSLTRYRMIIKEDVDSSVKKIKATFAELHSCIIDREVMLLSEVDKVKEEAMHILTARQKKAEELKRMTDLHFVSERKYDEELGRSARFSCDTEQLKKQILLCGELSHPKNYYSLRPSSSSTPPAVNLHLETGKQSTHLRKSPGYSKISERKTSSTKALNRITQNLTEPSLQEILPSKQNGPLSQRRRFNPRSQSIRSNGPTEPPLINPEVDQVVKNTGHRPQQSNFKTRNKGAVKNQEQPSSMMITKALQSELPKVETADSTSPSSNAASASQYCLRPARIEVSADAAVLSVPTVTLVA